MECRALALHGRDHPMAPGGKGDAVKMTRTEYRLQLLAARKRSADYKRWKRQARSAAMFPGVLIPFRPNRSAWWWRLEHDVRLEVRDYLPTHGMLSSLYLHGGYWKDAGYTVREKCVIRWVSRL